MISTSKGFLFVHVPKTGGNSIQEVLRKYSEDEIVIRAKHQDGVERYGVVNSRYKTQKHSTLDYYKNVIERDKFQNLFKFATIRNPWDMMVSFYFSPNRGVTEWNRNDFIELVENTPTLRSYICENSFLQTIFKRLGVNDAPSLKKLDSELDYLIRFEQIERDFKLVCDRLRVQYVPLKKRNSSRRGHYSAYYDKALVKIVENKFGEEIEFGGYRFESF